MEAKIHWEQVYRDKGPDQVSWFQAEAKLSLELIEGIAPDRESRILDVGAGASRLVDGLLAAGYSRLTVLDLSRVALDISRRRLGASAETVEWREGDVRTAPLPAGGFDLWHDRAVFHFLTSPEDRAQYLAQVRRAVRPGGFVLIATFAEDGPMQCSGLEVARYSAEALQAELGVGFGFIESRREEHLTPRGAVQAFTYCLCRVEPHSSGP